MFMADLQKLFYIQNLAKALIKKSINKMKVLNDAIVVFVKLERF